MRKFSIDKVRFYRKPASIEDIPGMIIPRKYLRKYRIYDLYDVFDELYANENDFIWHSFMMDIVCPPSKFIMECPNGRVYLVNTEGFDYARYIIEILDY